VAALALWVGAFGFLVPAQVEWALPWPVPPMHARFLGAMYLSGASFMIGAIAARRWSTVRIVVLMCATWTGMLLLVSLFHLPQFDWRKPQVWIWFLAYSAFPLGAAAIGWRRRRVTATGPCRALPVVLRRYLAGAGVLIVALAVALFVAPTALAAVWPWAITPLLAQIYSAPFLSYGVGSIFAARQRCFADVRLYLGATLVFTAGVLTASIIHRSLFSAAQVSDWLWFAGFGGATLTLAAGAALALLPEYRPDDRPLYDAGGVSPRDERQAIER
jgi:hypothetical protein